MIVRARHGRVAPNSPAARIRAATERATNRTSATARVSHPLADLVLSAALRRRAEAIDSAFTTVDPSVRANAEAQFRSRLAASYVLGTFCQLVNHTFDRDFARKSEGEGEKEGESAADLIQRWGFHAVDITPCADGRLSGVVDYILRVPPSIVAFRKSYAGAMFDIEESVRNWESVELRRWREARPNAATAPTRYLKIGVYHYSGTDPERAGCAAHAHDATRAATALLQRLEQFSGAIEKTHCCGAAVATLLIGVDTDDDSIRVHVPDARGRASADRYVDNHELFRATRDLAREAAKDAIRAAVATCAGVASDDAASEGMRWFCGYVLKNNLGQIDAVERWHGGAYADRGHTERLIVVGDALDDVQTRNLFFQAQMETVEEGGPDLDIGVRILRGLHEPRGSAVPVLVHVRFDQRMPDAERRARRRAARLRDAILMRYAGLVGRGLLHVEAVVRGDDRAPLLPVDPLDLATESFA